MQETQLAGGVANAVLNEIQQITIDTNIIDERQVKNESFHSRSFLIRSILFQQIVYERSVSSNGRPEIQSIHVENSIFQLGFRGVYTGCFLLHCL
jgi:hypothetical protein